MKPTSLAVALVASCVIGFPKACFGEEYVDKGLPLHGDPTQGGKAAEPAQPVDQAPVIKEALKTTTPVTESSGPGDTELDRLLARANDIRDGTSLDKKTIVEIRQHLGQFRADARYTAKIDSEINRLEAIILGLDVNKGKK